MDTNVQIEKGSFRYFALVGDNFFATSDLRLCALLFGTVKTL